MCCPALDLGASLSISGPLGARPRLSPACLALLTQRSADRDSPPRSTRLMRDSQANRTCVVVAHKLRTIEDADHIIVMANGQVVECGTHADLLIEANSTYSRM